MSIEVETDLDATREKLRWLEQYYEATRQKISLDPLAREDILLTTKRLINQFKEEIARFDAHTTTRAESE
jgi:hypothetical protein